MIESSSRNSAVGRSAHSGWRLDLIAGLTLAAIAIPEQMATAKLAGFPSFAGFVAFIIGSLAFAALGCNRFLSAGADLTIAPIFAGSLATLAAAGSPHYTALASMLALSVGAILIAAGLFRMSWVADLLSLPVTTGFLAGISIHVVISQIPTLLGLPSQEGSVFLRLQDPGSAPGHQSRHALRRACVPCYYPHRRKD